MIDRPRLYRLLDRWPEQRAIAIFAPTGYGKSSLVSRWSECSGHSSDVAWLSLNESDDEPRQFALDLAATLDQVLPGALALVRPILEDSEGSAERVLARLFASFWEEAGPGAASVDQHILLVLDDLHRIESEAVKAVITTMLEQGPDQLHLLLMAQRPVLPLARLAAHGRVMALGVQDLRFSADEVHQYVQRRGFGQPSQADVAQLAARSEGWVMALQLAVLSLDGHGSPADLLRVLRGESTWLAAYLTEEVLEHQTPEQRRFLLQTSLLDEFNADLCAAVTGQEDAHARLDDIAQRELFLTALDDARTWFRYHSLFQQLLQQRLRATAEPGVITDLHRRAADWLDGAGYIEAAVRHLLSAGDEDGAAALVESHLRDLVWREPYRARALLALLPLRALAERPQLMLDRCRLATWFDESSTLTVAQEAEATLQARLASDPDATRHRAEWLVLRAAGFFLRRDIPAAVADVRLAEHHLSYLDDFHLGMLRFLQMHLHGYAGRQSDAVQAAQAAVKAFERFGVADWAVAVRRELARWRMRQGAGAEATRLFRELLAHQRDYPHRAKRDLALAFLFATENSYWQDRLDQARVYQEAAMKLAAELQDAELVLTLRTLGRLLDQTGGEIVTDAQAGLGSLSQITTPGLFEPAVGYKTRLLISSGRPDSAWQMVQELGIDLQNIPEDRVQRSLITYLHAYVARGLGLAGVAPILARMLAIAAERGERFYQLQLLALSAWQQLQSGGAAAAAAPLLEAAQFARETGYIRVLLDIPELSFLLQKMGVSLSPAPTSADAADLPAIERTELSKQEMQVLQLLAADQTYEQIAAALMISVNTVRTHVRNVYRKLGANRRDQAIYQAASRGLLAA